jgi:hypothetical protein
MAVFLLNPVLVKIFAWYHKIQKEIHHAQPTQ